MTFPLEQATAHAAACYPMEACGLWVEGAGGIEFIPAEPSRTRGHFSIAPAKYLEAERAGALRGIFHTHCDSPPVPSQQDLVGIEAWGVPWVIMSWPSGEWGVYEPGAPNSPFSILNPPLLGRSFHYGSSDCYGLIRAYYARLGIALPDFSREAGWEKEGLDLYMGNYEKAGFQSVQGPPREHDVLLLQVNSPVPNHGAICLGGNRLLHHMEGRLSARAAYGDFYRKATAHVLRHKELGC